MVGEHFSGVPYVANTLEMEGKEALVINLRQFDCFTFIENVVVLAQLIEAGKTTFGDYTAQLERIRYRRGIVNGYSSRLHYFSDWLQDNEEKEILKDVTAEIGGRSYIKAINFMTRHPEHYPHLKVDASYREMLAVEERLSGRPMCFIPKTGLRQVEDRIKEGDIIGVTTGVDGLDVQHVGFALRVKKRVRLLHASTEEKKVVISESTLHHYLSKRKTCTGVIVGRVISIP
jgi:hypothetical protein